jgi:hypothetical protein
MMMTIQGDHTAARSRIGSHGVRESPRLIILSVMLAFFRGMDTLPLDGWLQSEFNYIVKSAAEAFKSTLILTFFPIK